MAAAGADCLYALGVTDLAEIRAIVEAVAPKPVNVLLMGPDMHVADLARAWVRRVSTGGTLARTAMAAAESEARGLLAEEAAVSAHPRVEEAGPRKCVPLRPDACLLVIDVQQGFDDPRWGPRNNPQAEDNIGVLLEDWRFMGVPIVHIHHDSTPPDSAFRPGSPGNAPKPVAIPRENETLYRKAVNSAFIGTDLETDLRAKGVGTLVVVGLTMNHCVSTTARMAGNLGFKTYVVADATATFARADLQCRMRSAAEVHAAALGDLVGEFATVVETAAVSQAVTNIFMARRLSCELP
jgi:nicotinamidase-related amidase